jgi:hypothetical protein
MAGEERKQGKVRWLNPMQIVAMENEGRVVKVCDETKRDTEGGGPDRLRRVILK